MILNKQNFTLIFLGLIFLFFLYERPSEEEKLLSTCKSETSAPLRTRCLIPYFEKLTREFSPRVAIAEAKKLQKEKVIDDCHIAAHIIGEENLKINDYDAGRAFSYCAPGCIEGCFHGVMEGYLARSTDVPETLKGIPNLCENVSNDPLLRRQCLHGVGHGLLRHDGTLLDALDLCKTFSDTFSQETCAGGVFMQNVNNIMFLDEDSFRKEIPKLCSTLSETGEKNLCIESVGEGIMFYTGHDLERSKDLCSELLTDERNVCEKGAEQELETNKMNL